MKQIQFINKFLNKLFYDSTKYNLLGRWCHKEIPNCNENVIEKKIDFALLDNNLCDKIHEKPINKK